MYRCDVCEVEQITELCWLCCRPARLVPEFDGHGNYVNVWHVSSYQAKSENVSEGEDFRL